MRFLVHVLELLFDELRIDLRGTDVRVAEHFLDRADIRAVFGGKAIYESLENCCDLCEHAADVIDQIIIKNT